MDDGDSEAAIRTALNMGITFFDTADVYRLGHAERVLSRALDCTGTAPSCPRSSGSPGMNAAARGETPARPGCRPRSTKACAGFGSNASRCPRFHWPDGTTPIGDTLAALLRHQEEGKIGAIGICSVAGPAVETALTSCRIQSLQVPFSLLERDSEEEMAQCRSRFGISVLTYNSLAQGLLTGKYGRSSTFSGTDLRWRSHLFAPEAGEARLQIVESARGSSVAGEDVPGAGGVALGSREADGRGGARRRKNGEPGFRERRRVRLEPWARRGRVSRGSLVHPVLRDLCPPMKTFRTEAQTQVGLRIAEFRCEPATALKRLEFPEVRPPPASHALPRALRDLQPRDHREGIGHRMRGLPRLRRHDLGEVDRDARAGKPDTAHLRVRQFQRISFRQRIGRTRSQQHVREGSVPIPMMKSSSSSSPTTTSFHRACSEGGPDPGGRRPDDPGIRRLAHSPGREPAVHGLRSLRAHEGRTGALLPRMPRGAVVAFDELDNPMWPGETMAMLSNFGIRNLGWSGCRATLTSATRYWNDADSPGFP